MNVLLSYINTQLFIFTLKLVRYQPNRTITGKFELLSFIAVGTNGYICTKIKNIYKVQQVGTYNWGKIIYGNGRYIVCGQNYVTTSTDGIKWDTPKQIGDYDLKSIAYGNGKFVTIDQKGYSYTTIDGVSWSTSVYLGSVFYDITYANGKFVAVGWMGNIAASVDGITWTTTTFREYDWKKITYGNGRFIIVGSSGTINGMVASSTDGVTWGSLKQVTNIPCLSATYGNGRFVLLFSPGSGYVYTSSDALKWSASEKIPAPTLNMSYYCINFISKTFIAVGSNGYISSSIDGITWTTPDQVKDDSGQVLNMNLYDICIVP